MARNPVIDEAVIHIARTAKGHSIRSVPVGKKHLIRATDCSIKSIARMEMTVKPGGNRITSD